MDTVGARNRRSTCKAGSVTIRPGPRGINSLVYERHSARCTGLPPGWRSIVSLHNIVTLPFLLLNRGQSGAAGVLFFFYAVILACIAKALFEIANFAGVKAQTGQATVIAKRIVPAHWEWQSGGRYLTRAYVEEYEVLDLIINGRKMTYRPIPWIMERTRANTTESVQFRAARFNGKVQIIKFKYL